MGMSTAPHFCKYFSRYTSRPSELTMDCRPVFRLKWSAYHPWRVDRLLATTSSPLSVRMYSGEYSLNRG